MAKASTVESFISRQELFDILRYEKEKAVIDTLMMVSEALSRSFNFEVFKRELSRTLDARSRSVEGTADEIPRWTGL